MDNIAYHHVDPADDQQNPADTVRLCLLFKSEAISGIHTKHNHENGETYHHDQHDRHIGTEKSKRHSD